MSVSDESDTRPYRAVSFIPNALSLARLALALAFPWVPGSWQIGVVAAAAASDFLDGALSRMMRASSTTGRILDPVADKAFALSVLVTLLIEQKVEIWHVLMVAARDLAVVAGVAWVCIRMGITRMRDMPPTWLGKVTTALQFAFILSVIYWQSVNLAFFAPTALCSIVAGVDYLRRYQARS
jgi:CDP-diacylglycerol--glycerol-3-phosphate 3-phosphatidyltransferase/cardiolipin synthase